VADRIALVEDHGLIAQTMAATLRARGAEVTIVDPALLHDGATTILDRSPEIVLLDLDLGEHGDGEVLIGPLAQAGATVVVVTGVTDPVRHARCLRAGAAGVLSKATSFDALLAAIERVREHGTILDAHEREERLRVLRAAERAERDRRAPFEELTPREAAVLGALTRGLTVETIAKDARVSVTTVRTQVRGILTKLGVNSQLAAVARAREAGWRPQERS
jgi:two-component system, NarL family, nitrate/nitrite response regulator NarL